MVVKFKYLIVTFIDHLLQSSYFLELGYMWLSTTHRYYVEIMYDLCEKVVKSKKQNQYINYRFNYTKMLLCKLFY